METLTFLFTDIEGSTSLLRRVGDDTYSRLLAEHHAIVRRAIDEYGGREQGTQGDSFFVVFTSPSACVGAAVEIQRALAMNEWPGGERVVVRMGIHTGEASEASTGMVGYEVHRAARVAGVASGGQILLSSTTVALVRDALPDGVTLRELGEHRLKDLSRPEAIAQVVAPGLVSEFAPLSSLDSRATNLPSELSSFVGRRVEVAEVTDLLRAHRLVTLTGTGGCGKTRLALHLAANERERYRDGVWCVELAATRSDNDVALAVAGVFALREEMGRSLIQTLVEQLSARDVLVVIDNCEHVLDASAELIESLLLASESINILVTSREPLGVAGEHVWRVPSLDLTSGVELFIQRAQQVQSGFLPNVDDRLAIDQIVERLDGIPLAIELAAARVRMMRPVTIAAALADQFRVLTGGSRTATPRQQTLEASIAWSYDLLEPAEQELARRLSVLRGFSLEAAEDIGARGGTNSDDVVELLAHLVDKSLVQVEHRADDDRYRMLESIRQFMEGRLISSGDADEVRARQFTHFLNLAEALAPLVALSEGPRWLAKLEMEQGNLDAAMTWGAEAASNDEMLRFATALSLYWEMRGLTAKGGRWFARVLGENDSPSSVTRARALWGAAHVAIYGGDFPVMARRAREALTMAEELDDEWTLARTLNTLGFGSALADPEVGRQQLARSVEIAERLGDQWTITDGLKMSTVALYVSHDETAAVDALEQLRVSAEAISSGFFLAWFHSMSGYFAMHRGDLAAAGHAFEVGRYLCEQVGDPSTGGFNEAWALQTRLLQGDWARATADLEVEMARASAAGSGASLHELVAALADARLATGSTGSAFELLVPVIEEMGLHSPPTWVGVLMELAGAAERQLGDADAARIRLDGTHALVLPTGNEWLLARIEREQALVALDTGDRGAAWELLHRALERQARHGLRPDASVTIDAVGALLSDLGDPIASTHCAATAEAMRSSMQMASRPVDDAARAQRLQTSREVMGVESFQHEWALASSLTVEEILARLS